jgi:hypothetical protein
VRIETGSTKPVRFIENIEDIKTTIRIEYFIQWDDLITPILFLAFRILSEASIDVPNGQIQPQKKRPNRMVKIMRTKAGKTGIEIDLEAIVAEKVIKGSNRRKNSTGIFNVNG